ncbi:reverse transcriptase domain-containing protein [Tanacetum coccineum]
MGKKHGINDAIKVTLSDVILFLCMYACGIEVKDKSPEKIPKVESEEDLEKEEELNEASKSDSNTLPLDYTASDEETDSDLDSTARSEARVEELEDTCKRNFRPKLDSPQTIHAYICTYKELLACKPRDFDGKGGVIMLTRWIEKMESVMDISGCVNNQKVRYASCSLINKALTWWNTQIQARGHEAALGMTWEEFKALLVEEFYPSNEMEKLEYEFWNHTTVGANHVVYTDRFHELVKLVPHLVMLESKRIDRYIHGLVPQIHGMIQATQPTTIQSAILKAGALTDEAVRCGTLSKSSEKRKEVGEPRKYVD